MAGKRVPCWLVTALLRITHYAFGRLKSPAPLLQPSFPHKAPSSLQTFKQSNGYLAKVKRESNFTIFKMSPKSSSVCSCGGKLKKGIALANHLKDSPKHKKPLTKDNAASSKGKSVVINTKPEGSALVDSTPTSHAVSAHPTMNNLTTVADRDFAGQPCCTSC